MLKELEQIGRVEDLQDYQCKVVSFSERHLMLGIRIFHPQIEASNRYLSFIGVYYFEGPIFWRGANFIKASNKVSVDVWKRVYPDHPDERIEKITKIFPVCMVQTVSKPILIAYGGVSISEEKTFSPN